MRITASTMRITETKDENLNFLGGILEFLEAPPHCTCNPKMQSKNYEQSSHVAREIVVSSVKGKKKRALQMKDAKEVQARSDRGTRTAGS
ncbi:hypothetical protein WH297_22990 [Ochrobactrum vermis]|uniref:Uncharacterized protein n=1 Tax=Ochrobactrum vermis TaxID=1827297 RepID=A0ABU8PJZ6_9HYPH